MEENGPKVPVELESGINYNKVQYGNVTYCNSIPGQWRDWVMLVRLSEFAQVGDEFA